MHGKTCVITGANSGIGREAARALLGMGAEVVLVCRNPDRAEEARRDIVATTGRDTARVVLCDLASQADVRRASAELLEGSPRIDVLINNAGLLNSVRSTTVDGLEATLAVNHLAPMLMTALLTDRLVATGSARVVTLTSGMHWRGQVDLDDLQATRRYGQFSVYANTKLMNVLYTRELARRLADKGVVANCVHPGVVATNFGPQRGIMKALTTVARKAMLSPAKGADTVVWLASAPKAARLTGEYVVRRRVAMSSPRSKDMALARRLWVESERLCGLA